MPLRLVRRAKSPNWVIRGTVRGIRVEESTGTGDRRAAEEIRAKREAEILNQSIHGRSATATFAQAFVSYSETGGSRRFMVPILKELGLKPLVRIDQDLLERTAKKLFPDAQPSTVNRQFFTPVSAVLHHAAKRGWCPRPIIGRPTQPTQRPRWLSEDEAKRLIDACQPHMKPLVLFLLYTGARAGEALWLDWKHVDLSRAHVTFEKTKNGSARGVPLHPLLVATLANLPHREGAVFRRPDGKSYARPRSADDTSAGTRIKTAFDGAVRRAGLSDVTPHDCRHTWATWHYMANRDLTALQRLGGWKSVAMVMRYTHSNVEEHAPSIARLPGGILGDAAQGAKKSS